MKRLLILGAGKEQVAAIAAAARKGIRTVALDMNPKAEGAEIADEFYAVSTRNVEAILGDCGLGWADVARVTTFLAVSDPGMMAALGTLYLEHVGEHRPARTTVGVAWLPLGLLVEFEVLAHHPEAT